MFEYEIDEILNGSHSVYDKLNLIKKLCAKLEMEVTKDYIKCPKCNQYYRANSWDIIERAEEELVCTYDDPINSGGNTYDTKLIRKMYNVCPVGHKFERLE